MSEQETVEEVTPEAQATSPAVEQKTNDDSKEPTEASEEEKSLLGEAGEEKDPGSVPESYEIKLPEGQEVDSEFLGQITPVLQKHKISQEAVQELAGVYAPYVQSVVERSNREAVESFQKQVDEWKAETTKALGENPKVEMAYAAKFMNKFGTQGLREILDATGLGNHPEVVQAFVKAGKVISEDVFVEPSKTSSPSKDNILKAMYPKMSAKK